MTEKRVDTSEPPTKSDHKQRQEPKSPVKERGGPKGPEPTRFGDWEKGGRCFDF